MRSRRRGPSLAAAVVLLVVVVTVGLVTVAIAGPVLVVVVLAMITLVAGLAAPLRSRSRRRGTGGDRPDEPSSPGPRWGVQWESEPPASAVPFARDQLTRVLAEWGVVGEAGEPTQLVVTELLSNAIDHGSAPVQLVVSFPGDSVRVEVHDAAAEPPRLQPQDPWQARGRGLQMVDALSSRWGWTPDPAGKSVWADVVIGWPAD